MLTNWQTGKYATLMELQNDVAKNSLWRSSIVIIPRSGGSGTHQNKGKSPTTLPTFKRYQPIVFRLNNSGTHDNFGGNGSKSISNSKGQQGQLKDAKADFKRHTKLTTFDRSPKRERSTSSRNYESLNRAKRQLTFDAFNRRRQTNACINCRESWPRIQ